MTRRYTLYSLKMYQYLQFFLLLNAILFITLLFIFKERRDIL